MTLFLHIITLITLQIDFIAQLEFVLMKENIQYYVGTTMVIYGINTTTTEKLCILDIFWINLQTVDRSTSW